MTRAETLAGQGGAPARIPGRLEEQGRRLSREGWLVLPRMQQQPLCTS